MGNYGPYWRNAIIGVVLGWGIFPYSAVQGAEWSAELDMSGGGEFNDNLTLTTRPHHSVWGIRIKPEFRLQYATEVLQVRSGGDVEYIKYFGKDGRSLTNASLPLSVEHQGERDRWGGSYTFLRDNTLQTELQETGVVLAFRQRNAHQIGLNWDRHVAERFVLQTNYQFGHIHYDKGLRFGLFDYQVHTGMIGGSHQVTEKFTLRGNGLYSFFRVPDIPSRTQSFGIEGGMDYQVSEIWQVSLSGGGRYVHSVRRGVSSRTDDDLVWLVSASLGGKWEQFQGNISYNRTLNPSGNGRLIETDRLFLDGNYQWTERISIGASAATFWTSQAGGTNGNQSTTSTKFFQTGSSVRWQVAEQSSVTLGYQFSRRKSRSTKAAYGNALSLFYTHQIGRLAISR